MHLSFFIVSCQFFSFVTTIPVQLSFQSKIPFSTFNSSKVLMTALTVPSTSISIHFRFTGKLRNNSIFQIQNVYSHPPSTTRSPCLVFDRSPCLIAFEDKSETYVTFIFRLEAYAGDTLKFFHWIIVNSEPISKWNLICLITTIPYVTRPPTPTPYPSSKISLFTIIFLSACVLLIVGLSIIWFLSIYYRRYRHYREKKKLRQALARSTEEILRKSPVITYDANDPNLNHEDPTCAICLETFQAEDQLRKLVCAHVFHVKCIDPWLFTRQQCPLCNRNIFRNSIPSISSNIIMGTDDSITNRVYPTAPIENSPM